MKKAAQSILIEMAGSLVAVAGYLKEVIFLFRARDKNGKFHVPEYTRSLNTNYSTAKLADQDKNNVLTYRKVSKAPAPRPVMMTGARRARR